MEVPLPLGLIESELGEALREKSAGALVKLATLDHAPFTPPEGASAWTCQ